MGLVPGLLVALAVAATLAAALDLVTHRTIRTIAVRNVLRRRSESLLVVLGSLLGAAIIVATFVVGDTITASVRDTARTRLGPVDVIVSAPVDAAAGTGLGGDAPVVQADRLAERVERARPAGVDGVMGVVFAGAAVAVPGDGGEVEPRVQVAEGDLDVARRFGATPGIGGLDDAGPTPTGDEVIINESLSRRLGGVRVGDRVEVFLGGPTFEGRVRAVLPEVGLAGLAPIWVPPGTIDRSGPPATAAAAPPRAAVLVSMRGGVLGAVDPTDAVAGIGAALAGTPGLEVSPRKQEVLEQADRSGERLSRLFMIVGSFSVIAGVALLVNLFVMLAEERRSEMGILRAVGLKRLRLVRLFGAEGLLYSGPAAVLGTLVGVGVGRVLVTATRGILAADDPDLAFRFAAEPSSLVLGGGLGLLIAMGAIAVTSAVVGRMNIISAIRDLPNPRRPGRRVAPLVAATFGVALGAALYVIGLRAPEPLWVLLGVPMMGFGSIPLLRRVLPARVATALGASVALVWAVVVFGAHESVMRSSAETVFIVQGVTLVGAAVTLTGSLDRLWARVADLAGASRWALALRLALAYPLARRFRSGLTVAMFSLVLFVMTLLTVLDAAFTSSSLAAADAASTGYDVVVDTNPATVPDRAAVSGVEGVAEVAELRVAAVAVRAGAGGEARRGRLAGIDESFVRFGSPALEARAPELADDAAVWRAVLDAPGSAGGASVEARVPWAVVAQRFVQRRSATGGTAGAPTAAPGDVVSVEDPGGGPDRQVRIAGVLADDPLRNGGYVAADALGWLAPGRFASSRWYVAVADGVDPENVVARLNRQLIRNGAEAMTFRGVIESGLTERRGFMALLRGFLGLGLLIGVAGLAVVMIRAVRERRREIGMLRAMGFQRSVVRLAFVTEAAFLAVQGVVLGVGLGLVTGWRITAGSDVFGTRGVRIELPWVVLIVLAVAPLLAALAATALPAAAAARLGPSEALRLTE